VFVAFTPTFGLHTFTSVFLAGIFRVSAFITVAGSLVMNPLTLVPLYGFCLWLGLRITGSGTSVPPMAWNSIDIAGIVTILKPHLWPFLAGTLIVGLAAGCITYFLFYGVAARIKKKAST